MGGWVTLGHGPHLLAPNDDLPIRSRDETLSLPSLFTPRVLSSTCAAAWHYSEIAISRSRDEAISLPSSFTPRVHSSTCAAALRCSEIAFSLKR